MPPNSKTIHNQNQNFISPLNFFAFWKHKLVLKDVNLSLKLKFVNLLSHKSIVVYLLHTYEADDFQFQDYL